MKHRSLAVIFPTLFTAPKDSICEVKTKIFTKEKEKKTEKLM